MGEAIGIDFGTSNSVAAYRTRSVQVLKSNENEELTPSVVSWQSGQFLVGRPALSRALFAPRDTVWAVKRLLGRRFADEEVQRFNGRVSFEIAAVEGGTQDDVRVVLGGTQRSPIEIASLILQKIRLDACARLRREVTHAVITVPANFSEKQYAATRHAAEKANLSVLRLLQEPFAAAISYGVDNIGADEVRRVVVFDIGAGTFDISVLMCTGGTFEILQHGGDRWLGGEDMDQRLADHVLAEVRSRHGVDGREEKEFLFHLRQAAEQAKIQLSNSERATISIPGKLRDARGELLTVEAEITRALFESMIAADVERAVELTRATVLRAGLVLEEVDNVLLVGGPSLIPLVRQSIERLFGAEKLSSSVEVDPMTCVARGAAVLADRLREVDEVECVSCGSPQPSRAQTCGKCAQRVHLVDVPTGVTRMDIGIETDGGAMSVILRAGTAFGSRVSRVFYTPAAGMRRLRIPVLQGESAVAAQNERIAIAWIPLPENVAMNTPVEVTFQVTEDGDFDEGASQVAVHGAKGGPVRFRLDRGGERRDAVERRLYEVEKTLAESRRSEGAQTRRRLRADVDRVVQNLGGGNLDEAERDLRQVEKRVEETSSGGKDGWIPNAQFWVHLCEATIRDAGFLLQGDAAYEMEKVTRQLANDIEARDAEIGIARKEELVRMFDALPAVVWNIMFAQVVFSRVQERDPVKADRILGLRRDLIAQLKEKRGDQARQTNDALVAMLIEAREPEAKRQELVPTDLVGEFKRPTVHASTLDE
ncbi:MAG: Hsp70 family protein [Planctomycetes bacterium]|nr:Hsp70 family protein [Planctomycetota bacterium]